MSQQTTQLSDEALAVGTRVEIRNRFDGSWSAGFEVDGSSGGGYWLRRRSDRTVLPVVFLGDDLRPEVRPPPAIDLT